MGATILPDTIYTIIRGLGDRISGVERMLISPFGPHLATALPSDPVDGQTIVYSADITNSVVWVLRFNESSSSIYKWEYIGGPPMYTLADGSQSTASTTFVALSGDPTLTLPLAGDYDIVASMNANNNSNPQNSIMSYTVGATAADDQDAAVALCSSAVFLHAQSAIKPRRKTITTASTAITAQYRVSGGTGTFANRVIRATPVRVG